MESKANTRLNTLPANTFLTTLLTILLTRHENYYELYHEQIFIIVLTDLELASLRECIDNDVEMLGASAEVPTPAAFHISGGR